MTRDEVKLLISTEIAEVSGWGETDHFGEAERVLAAFAARGLIIGERVSNDEFERTHGIAVVRVVPND